MQTLTELQKWEIDFWFNGKSHEESYELAQSLMLHVDKLRSTHGAKLSMKRMK